jgi:hypothetical protein
MGISLPTWPDLYLEMQRVNSNQRWNAESRNKNLNLIVSPMTEEEWEKAN